jgi:hypothetical protein
VVAVQALGQASWRTAGAALARAWSPAVGGECAAFHSLGWLRSRSLAHLAHASYQYTRPYTQTPPPGGLPQRETSTQGRSPRVFPTLELVRQVRQKGLPQPPEAARCGALARPGCASGAPCGAPALNRGGWREGWRGGDRPPGAAKAGLPGNRAGGPVERVRPTAPTGTVCQNETEETATHRQRPMEAILDAIGGLSAGRAGVAPAGVFDAMKRGPIPGVNIAPNTAFRGYRGGETGLSAQSGQTLAIAPNTLP